MVRNVLKNGQVIKDMSKVKVPVNNKTVRAYEMLAKAVKK